jgi:RNA polymerase sigma-70 factor (ECF subfamily)
MITTAKSSPRDLARAQQKFLSLFLSSQRDLFGYVATMVPCVADAEDIVQQTALMLWEKFDTYDPSRPFTPWARGYALNKTREWFKERQRWQALLEDGLAEELAQRRTEFLPELDSRLAHLEGCLSKLPKEQHSLVEGYYFHRKSVVALAAMSGRTTEATYKALQRIRTLLQECVQAASQSFEGT